MKEPISTPYSPDEALAILKTDQAVAQDDKLKAVLQDAIDVLEKALKDINSNNFNNDN